MPRFYKFFHERSDFGGLRRGELALKLFDFGQSDLFHTAILRIFLEIMLITLDNVRFGYDDKIILDGVSFTLSEKERIGFIGANGEGKTTLLRLMAGSLSPDEGKIYKKGGLKIGWLEQNGGLESDKTVYEEMRSVFGQVYGWIGRLRETEQKLASVPYGGEQYRELSSKYEQLERAVAAADGYNADVRIKTVLNGMGFADMYDQKISTMSGGEKTRLKLCRLLLEEPELLFLDEPTNHLDVQTLFWLEDYLKEYRGAIFTVSHDRYFLDAVVGKIFELENKKVTAFRGNYSKYKILKAEKYEHDLKEYERQQEEIAQLKDYVARNIVRATTAKSAQSRVKKLESMELLEKPLPPPKPPKFSFDTVEKSEERALSVTGLSLSAGGKTLLRDASFEVRRGEKIAIVGENGTGKSTLIRALVQKRDPAVRWGRFNKIGYYDQENADLDPEETVLGALWHKHTGMTQTQVRALLARAKLDDEDMEKKVKSLSGGERAKLSLVLLEALCANFLVLDEPTNHLDLPARESLESALKAFDGTLLFVSHDRYFIQGLADKIIEIGEGNLTVYDCGYEEYTAAKKAREEQQLSAKKAEKAEMRAAQSAASYRSKAERAEEARKKQKLKETESKIAAAEAEIAALNGEIAKPDIAADYKLLTEKCARLDELHAIVEKLYEEYETLL